MFRFGSLYSVYLPKGIIPETARNDEPAVDSDDETVATHLDLLAEIVPQVPPYLMPRGVGHDGQDGVHGQGEVAG